MRPRVGFWLGGASFTQPNAPTASAWLGEPLWGPGSLLRDLELRLALSGEIPPRSVRVPSHAARIATASDATAFYAASFAADAIGTADTLLAWRDMLVEAGWDGREIPGGGDRLAALTRLESPGDQRHRGEADRLVAVLAALTGESTRVYDEILLTDDRALWPGRWQQIFDALELGGTSFTAPQLQMRGARSTTDLGWIQGLLRGYTRANRDDLPAEVRGDGSLLVLRADTPVELAALTAAFLATEPDGALVVRADDPSPLEAALGAHGLAAQGLSSSSSWRPAMQILPLSVELAFAPRDPHRALELLALPVGPFRGVVGTRLAKAVARSPGIGGREWQKRKDEVKELLHAREVFRSTHAGRTERDAVVAADAYVAERMQRVTDWFEVPGASPNGAPADLLREVAARVLAWLHARLVTAPDVYGPALVQARAFVDALAHEPRAVLSREAVRQLLDAVVRAPHDHVRSTERAGRIAHVPHPSAILAPCATLVLWSSVADADRRPPILPWTRAERAAVAAAGIRLQDPASLVMQESQARRRALLAATERVVFAIPGSTANGATASHPLWDEISARLCLDAAAVERLTRRSREIRSGRQHLVPVAVLDALALPDSPAIWKVTPAALVANDADTAGSVTSLETLASCPLRWVLEERAKLASGAVAKIAADSLLCGNLGHRLVEELFIERAFEKDARVYAARAEAILERLVDTEASTLLLPGMGFERAQLVPQLLRAMRELRRYLERSGFRVAAVEEAVSVPSPAGTLQGRVDLRLVDASGAVAVLDLKWGESRYRDVVREGRAIQLSAYARAVRVDGSDAPPPAGYFALRSGRVVTADPRMNAVRTFDGQALDGTWMRVERTARAVVECLTRGEIPVSGVRASLPLLDALGIDMAERSTHYEATPDAACTYCRCASLCGRAWKAFR